MFLSDDDDEDGMLMVSTPNSNADEMEYEDEDDDEDGDGDGGEDASRTTKIAQNSEAFVEQFALGTNSEREELLKQVLPGSEDFYFYNIVHLLNKASSSSSDKTPDEEREKLRKEVYEHLDAFKKLHPQDQKLPILERRLTVLLYGVLM